MKKFSLLFAMLLTLCMGVMAETKTCTVIANSSDNWGNNGSISGNVWTSTDENFTVTYSSTAVTTNYFSGKGYRYIYTYKNNAVTTLSVATTNSNYTIKGISAKFYSSNTKTKYGDETSFLTNNSSSPASRSVDSSPFTFKFINTNTSNSYINFTYFVITYEDQNSSLKSEAPALDDAAEFVGTKDITITNKEEGATVYYTTDGTDPTTSSASFTGASRTLTLDATTTVKAMAAISGKDNSNVASATYTKLQTYTLGEAATLDAGDGYIINFTGAVCTGKRSSYLSIEDATGAMWIQVGSSNSTPYASISVGKEVNGYMKCSINNLNTSSSSGPSMKYISVIGENNITITDAATIPLTTLTWDELHDNFSKYYAKRIKVENVTVTSDGKINGVGSTKTAINAYAAKFDSSAKLPVAGGTYNMIAIPGNNSGYQLWPLEFSSKYTVSYDVTGLAGTSDSYSVTAAGNTFTSGDAFDPGTEIVVTANETSIERTVAVTVDGVAVTLDEAGKYTFTLAKSSAISIAFSDLPKYGVYVIPTGMSGNDSYTAKYYVPGDETGVDVAATGSQVLTGSKVTVTASCDADRQVSLSVNGTPVNFTSKTYTIENLGADQTFALTFSDITYNVTVYGHKSDADEVKLYYKDGTEYVEATESAYKTGTEMKLVLTAGEGREVKSLQVNGAEEALTEGAYEFTLTKNTGLTYAFGDLQVARTTAVNKYGTICLPYNATVEGADVMTLACANWDGTNVKSLTFDYDETTCHTLTAGVPYLYRATTDAPVFKIGKSAYADAKEVNGLIGSYSEVAIPTGYFFLYTEGGVQQFGKAADDTNVCGANKAYINMDNVPAVYSNNGARKTVTLGVHFDTETGLYSIDANAETNADGKFVKNGRMVIVKNGKQFNMAGQIVK